MVPRRPPAVPWPGPPAAAGGRLEGPKPKPPPPPRPAAWRRTSFPAECWAWAVWHPWAPGAVWLAAGASVCLGGLGRSVCRPPSWARLGGPGGQEAGGRPASVRTRASLGRAPKLASLALPCPWGAWPPYCTGSRPRAAARTRSVGCPCAPVLDCWPVAVTAGVGGQHISGRAAYRLSGAPPRVPQPSRGGGGGGLPWSGGGMRGRSPLGRPPAVHGLGGGGVAPGLPAVPLRSPGASLRWLPWAGKAVSAPAPPVADGTGGLAVGGRGGLGEGDGGLGPDSGGGRPVGGYPGPLARSPLPPPLQPPGVGPSCRPSPTTHPPLSSPSPRCVAPAGGIGGGAAGARGGGTGQQLVVSGLRVSQAPVRASVAPAASRNRGGACPPVVRTAGGRGGALRIGGPGPSGGVSRAVGPLPPPRVRRLGSGVWPAGRWTIAAGRSRHLRRLRGGWGCGGGGFLGR